MQSGDGNARWLTAALARPVVPLAPEMTCGDVFGAMSQDHSMFAAAVVADDVPLGLVDRTALMSNFARQYWREIYARQPITKLMDPAPLMIEAELPIEAVGSHIATLNGGGLGAGFIVQRDGCYVGIGSTLELLKRVAERAHEHNEALQAAHREIRAFNDDLEQRIAQRTAELHATQQQLLDKERLSALGQLTATVAHEIRNPLSSIRNTVFALKEATADGNASLQRQLDRVERNVVRCDRIIGDLLDFTRVRAPRTATVLLDEWLAELLDEQPQPEGVSIRRRFGAAGLRIRLDPEQMRRVIVNLVENATHALVAANAGDRVITVGTRSDADGFTLTIADTGPGIPADVLPRVFEPLFSTKSFGTGLGLPTVKQIVEQHRGAITLASEPGRGTVATIRLPREARQAAA